MIPSKNEDEIENVGIKESMTYLGIFYSHGIGKPLNY